MADDLPILCLDFDGVIHDYKLGWQDGSIYGDLTPGFLDWAHQAGKLFKLVVYSSRSAHPHGIPDMSRWLVARAGLEGWSATTMPSTVKPVMRLLHARRADVILLSFAHEKPPAFLTIDDRAIQFQGYWEHAGLDPAVLRQFKPWNAVAATVSAREQQIAARGGLQEDADDCYGH